MPPIVLDTTPRTEVAATSLIQTDNKLFNKVVLVFAYLCEEALSMRERARDHLVPALLLLAEQPAVAAAAADAGGLAAARLLRPVSSACKRRRCAAE